jgi:hypothetical protein
VWGWVASHNDAMKARLVVFTSRSSLGSCQPATQDAPPTTHMPAGPSHWLQKRRAKTKFARSTRQHPTEKHTTNKGRLGGWEVYRSKNNNEDPCVNVRGNGRVLHHALCVVAARLTSPSWVGSGCRSGVVCVCEHRQARIALVTAAHQSSKKMKLSSVLFCHLVEMVGHSDLCVD